MSLRIKSQGPLLEFFALLSFCLWLNLLSIRLIVVGGFILIGEQRFMSTISWHFFYSIFIVSSIQHDSPRGLRSGGSWCSNCFKHPYWLGGAINECHKCFQHHLWEGHLSKASYDMKPIVSKFPFYLVLLCPISSLFLQPPFPFEKFVFHPFFEGHAPSDPLAKPFFV